MINIVITYIQFTQIAKLVYQPFIRYQSHYLIDKYHSENIKTLEVYHLVTNFVTMMISSILTKSKGFYILLIFSMCYVSSNAAVGCIGGITGDLYTSTSDGVNYTFANGLDNPQNTYCISNWRASGSCRVAGVSSYLVDYNLPVNCPLDENLWIPVTSLAILSFFSLRTNYVIKTFAT